MYFFLRIIISFSVIFLETLYFSFFLDVFFWKRPAHGEYEFAPPTYYIYIYDIQVFIERHIQIHKNKMANERKRDRMIIRTLLLEWLSQRRKEVYIAAQRLTILREDSATFIQHVFILPLVDSPVPSLHTCT